MGAHLGSSEFTTDFVREKVDLWLNELKTLSEIATTQPHAAYAAFTHGFYSKWSHLSHIVPNLGAVSFNF